MDRITTPSALQTALERCRPQEDLTTQSVAAMKIFSDNITKVQNVSFESREKLNTFIINLNEKLKDQNINSLLKEKLIQLITSLTNIYEKTLWKPKLPLIQKKDSSAEDKTPPIVNRATKPKSLETVTDAAKKIPPIINRATKPKSLETVDAAKKIPPDLYNKVTLIVNGEKVKTRHIFDPNGRVYQVINEDTYAQVNKG